MSRHRYMSYHPNFMQQLVQASTSLTLMVPQPVHFTVALGPKHRLQLPPRRWLRSCVKPQHVHFRYTTASSDGFASASARDSSRRAALLPLFGGFHRVKPQHVHPSSSSSSSDDDWFASVSAGGSLHPATPLPFFSRFHRVGEPGGASSLAEADMSHEKLVLALGDDCEGGCSLEMGSGISTWGMRVFCASLLPLG